MSKWHWIYKKIASKLWVRASLFCAVGIFTALLALLVRGYIPDDISRKIGADAVDSILTILASSMLAVTTFSLSTMVSAYSAASNSATPRATKLLLEDSTAQNALSTFIGAFLFSLVGIIALHTGIYGDSGRIVLFVVTLIVIFIIIAMLIKWIEHLSQLGRMGKTIAMVEDATEKTLKQELERPNLGGTPVDSVKTPPKHCPVMAPKIGYVQYIDMNKLSTLAEKLGIFIFISIMPGEFNDLTRPIAYTIEKLAEEDHKTIIDSFSIEPNRSFDQDLRYGFVILSQIASRALSPAVNDPGTSLDVISTTVRILAPYISKPNFKGEILYPRVYVPNIQLRELFEDIFMPIARDGASLIEVQLFLQRAFFSLSQIANEEIKKLLYTHSQLAVKRANLALKLQEDKDALKALELK